MSLVFVEHQVKDMEAWGEIFQKFLAMIKDMSPEDAEKLPLWGDNKCYMTLSSDNFVFMLWKFPSGSTTEEIQAFIDKDAGDDPAVVNNVVYRVDGSMGIQNLSFETYVDDCIQLAKEGATKGFSADGELYFVHHNIHDKAKWNEMFMSKFDPIKGKSTSKDITDAWEVGDGVKTVMWCGLGDKDAVCVWSMPKWSTESDVQVMIDKFCGDFAKNDIYKIEPTTALGTRAMHPDFYAQEAIAFANKIG